MANEANNNIISMTKEQFTTTVVKAIQKTDTRTASKIVSTLTEGDVNHAPSSDAVLKSISSSVDTGVDTSKSYTDEKIAALAEDIAGINNWQTKVIVGDLPEEPDTKTIYLQIDDDDDKTYIMKIYSDGKWIDIGDTSIDLVNYLELASLKSLLGMDTDTDLTADNVEAAIMKIVTDNTEKPSPISDSELDELLDSAFDALDA